MVVFSYTFCRGHAILPISGSFKMSQLFTSGLLFFRIHWFDLLAIQGTLNSLLQHHNSKGPVIQHPAFFMVQLSHLYMITGKAITLTIWTFVGKLMSLFFHMLSRFVIDFLWRVKCLLIWWLQSHTTVILEPKKNKSATVSTFFQICLPWSDVIRPQLLVSCIYQKYTLPSRFVLSLFPLLTTSESCTIAQSCLTLCDLMDYTVHGILQARILEWVAFPFSRGSSWPRNGTRVSCTAGGFFTNWAMREGHFDNKNM